MATTYTGSYVGGPGSTGPNIPGIGQQQVIKDKQKYLAAARARGLSQAKIDAFLKENPEDYHRLSQLQINNAPVAGLAAAAPTAPGGAGGGGSVGPGNVSGGSGVFAPGEGGESAGGGVAISAPGTLRQGIGTRILPMTSMALAGLQRLY